MRQSARRKQHVVLRLLRGERLEALAHERGQAGGVIAGWRDEFLAAGQEGLKSRPALAEDRRLAEVQDRRVVDGSGQRQGAGGRDRAVPSVAEALSVQTRLDAPLGRVCRSPACRGRRRASSAADSASRRRWALQPHAAGLTRSAPCPTISCWWRSAASWTSHRSLARATRRSALVWRCGAFTSRPSACCV